MVQCFSLLSLLQRVRNAFFREGPSGSGESWFCVLPDLSFLYVDGRRLFSFVVGLRVKSSSFSVLVARLVLVV